MLYFHKLKRWDLLRNSLSGLVSPATVSYYLCQDMMLCHISSMFLKIQHISHLCEFECENCYHFFIECPLYDNIRRNLFVFLRIFGEIDLNVILYGNTELLIDQNKDITFNRSKQGYYF
jgi:hypothetical protein